MFLQSPAAMPEGRAV